jgi:hypothetical protein
MTSDPIRGVPPVGAERAPQAPVPAGDGLDFRRLLERLEELARRDAPPAADVETFRDAVRAAGDDFAAAMDLRRRLEDAFRQRGP